MTYVIFLLALLTFPVSADVLPANDPISAFKEYRQCGEPLRNKDGSIKRSTAVLNAYKKLHPCPVTGLSGGACPGWAINHVIPLAKGGCDSVINLMWVPDQIKSCSKDTCIDRWEREYYGNPHGILEPRKDQ